jgi:two-component system chemotaxis family response regulator WspR
MTTRPHQPFRILIADDDPAVVARIAQQAREAGHDVCGMVSTATAAIAAVAEEKPDLVVMDAALGEGDDGVKTAMQMRLAHNVALIFLSANDDEDTLRRVLSVSPSGYLIKPVRARDLKVTLELALRRHKREADERHSLQSLAQTDSLTGLSNRRHLDETLADEWNRCGKEGKPLGVLMVDIDHFKKFNDSFGHMAGDLCLARVAETLKAACRHPTKTVGRWGGEEFLVILPDSDAPATQRTGELILQAVRESGDASRQALSQQAVTISVGAAAASLPVPGATPRDLIHLADMRLYAAKRGGRNQVSGGPPLTIDAPSTPQS